MFIVPENYPLICPIPKLLPFFSSKAIAPEAVKNASVSLPESFAGKKNSLFLGYPPEDVCGFMKNKACNCKCVGCWKVYGDEEAAKKKFAQYKKCTQVYSDQWANGTDIERLTVAG